MQSIYDDEDYKNIISRIDNIAPFTKPLWGKMTAPMMLAHCTEVLLVYTGDKKLKVNFMAKLFKGMIAKIVFGPEPYKKNSATVPQFKIVDDKYFEPEKKKLLLVIHKLRNIPQDEAKKIVHPLFGKMKKDEIGWAMYKHLNHHLEQFGV